MLMITAGGLGRWRRHLPLLMAIVFFATGDYMSLIRLLRFVF
ncbi:MAG: hypothetical protein ABSD99_05350 [Candidatus Bathyarchaeia archaeon]